MKKEAGLRRYMTESRSFFYVSIIKLAEVSLR